MAKKALHTIVLPDGGTDTRKSAREYTHVVVCWATDAKCWCAMAWSQSLANAEKACAQWERHFRRNAVNRGLENTCTKWQVMEVTSRV